MSATKERIAPPSRTVLPEGTRPFPATRLPFTNVPLRLSRSATCHVAPSKLSCYVGRRYRRVSETVHVPGVHDNDNALIAAVPVQLWGPASVIWPAEVTEPVKPSKGGANDSEQFVCVTVAV